MSGRGYVGYLSLEMGNHTRYICGKEPHGTVLHRHYFGGAVSSILNILFVSTKRNLEEDLLKFRMNISGKGLQQSYQSN